MTNTYTTGNPLGSTDPRDLLDNASNLDDGMNSVLPTFVDRLGVSRDTWAGMQNAFALAQSGREAEFQQFLTDSGFVSLGNYAPGLNFTAYNQYMARDGFFYRPAPSTIPFTTTGTWVGGDDGFFNLFSPDHVLRKDLANDTDPAKGAGLVGRVAVAVDSVSDLLLQPQASASRYMVKGYYAESDIGGGEFHWEQGRARSDHNGGSVISPTVPWDGSVLALPDFLEGVGETEPLGSGCWIRVNSTHSASTFGAVPDDTSNDYTASIDKYLEWSGENGLTAIIEPGKYSRTASVYWKQRTHSIIATGATFIYADDFVGQNAIEFANQDWPLDDLHEQFGITGLTLIGPLEPFGKDGIKTSANSGAAGARVTFDNVSILGFRRQHVIGSHSPFTWWRNCNFTGREPGGFGLGTCIYWEDITNTGEQLVYDTCQFNNVHTIVENTAFGVAGGLTFNSCGFDYFVRAVYATKPLRIRFNHGWIEGQNFSENWFYMQGDGANLYLNNPEIWFTNNPVSNYIFNAGVDADIFVINPFIHCTSSYAANIHFLADPAQLGNTFFEGFDSYKIPTTPARSRSDNACQYFEDESGFISQWVSLSAELPAISITIDAAQPYIRPGGSLVMTTNTVGQVIDRAITVPVNTKRGSRLAINVTTKLTGFVGSEAALSVRLLDNAGGVISTIYTSTLDKSGAFVTSKLWFQPRVRKASAIRVDIYANAQQAGESVRQVVVGELTVNP